jgi:hypothetical protein
MRSNGGWTYERGRFDIELIILDGCRSEIGWLVLNENQYCWSHVKE